MDDISIGKYEIKNHPKVFVPLISRQIIMETNLKRHKTDEKYKKNC